MSRNLCKLKEKNKIAFDKIFIIIKAYFMGMRKLNISLRFNILFAPDRFVHTIKNNFSLYL